MSVIHVLSGIPPCPIVLMHRPSVSLLTMTFFESLSFAVWYGYFMARAFIELLILDPWEWAEAAEKKFALWPDQTRRQECLRSDGVRESESPLLIPSFLQYAGSTVIGRIGSWLHPSERGAISHFGFTINWARPTTPGQVTPSPANSIPKCWKTSENASRLFKWGIREGQNS